MRRSCEFHCLLRARLLIPSGMNPEESAGQQPDYIHSDEFLRHLMRRQLRLSIGCALAFLVLLVGLPLANYLAPEFMARRVFGFTLTWLVLGVLVFPFVWIIAGVFIKRSIALEEAEVREVEQRKTASKD